MTLAFPPHGTLLASLGILSFAISLGAQDLVTDILTGLSIFAEKGIRILGSGADRLL